MPFNRGFCWAQRKLKNIVMKAESMGTSLAEVFGVFDKDGSGFVTAVELEEGLRELRVFDTIPRDQVETMNSALKYADLVTTAVRYTPHETKPKHSWCHSS